MSEQIKIVLKKRVSNLSDIDAETGRNILKEELQFHVLNFVYHHPEYSKWIMYGGSALRILHNLNRMSVDLDFEIPTTVTEKLLDKVKKEIEDYFKNKYSTDTDFLKIKIVNGRGLLLKFDIGQELSFGYPSNQIHLKIDLNHFTADRVVVERRPVNHDQLSFVIITYNMSSLMASKIAAIFLRGPRGVGKDVYEEKGRDIYDLLWYMNKKVIPDLDYLTAKKIDVKNMRLLFDKLTIQMNKVSDENLRQDLFPLFIDRDYVENWIKNWRETYFHLLDNYQIRTIIGIDNIKISEDPITDNIIFSYECSTKEKVVVRVAYILSEDWLNTRIGVEVTKLVKGKVGDKSLPIQQYTQLFYEKTEEYFQKTNKIMLGNEITTKLIRTTADKLNSEEQIVLNKSSLLSCGLEDLLK